MRTLFTLLIGILFIVSGCKEEPIAIPDYIPPNTDRIVLLEDFTGVSCPNCPEAEREINNLKSLFPDNVVSVSIHTDELGTPKADSKYDFRTDAGNQLQDYLGTLLAKPAGVIDRKIFDGSNSRFNIDVPTWAANVAEELQDFSALDLRIEHEYDPGSRELTLQVITTPKSVISSELKISVMITESGIIDPQDDVTGKITDYEHNHVLRTFLTDFKGNSMGQGPFMGQQEYISDFHFVIPPEDGWWVAEHCHILAFVSEVDGASIEVLQAMEVDITD